MKFGSWTYDGYRLDVVLEAQGGDTKKYIANGEWNLIGMPAQRNEIIYVCCPEPYPDVTYTVHIRRRTTYYYVNLIIPCVLITCKSTSFPGSLILLPGSSKTRDPAWERLSSRQAKLQWKHRHTHTF